jgi:hypothetical protein
LSDELATKRGIPPQLRVLVAIFTMIGPHALQRTSDLFGIGLSTVHLIQKQVFSAIYKKLLPRHVRWPTGAESESIMAGFQAKHGFIGVCGALDGTHVAIVAPANGAEDFYCRKNYYSIVTQAVCDHLGRFTDIVVGWPGSVHDARVLKNSNLWNRAEAGTLLNRGQFLLADAGYPLRPWLITPYKFDRSYNKERKVFNYCHSSTRIVVERSFGMLKGRFRSLLGTLDMSVGVPIFTLLP